MEIFISLINLVDTNYRKFPINLMKSNKSLFTSEEYHSR